MKRLNQSGSHILAVALFVLVLSVIGFAGYTVSQRNKTVSSSAAVTATSGMPATIQTEADLSATAASLDNSSADLNNSVNGATLDSNLNDLL